MYQAWRARATGYTLLVNASLDKVCIYRYLVLGTWYLVPGTWYLVRTWYQVPSTWYQVAGTCYQVPGTRYLVPGTRYLVPGTCTRYLVPGIRYLLPVTWYQVTRYRTAGTCTWSYSQLANSATLLYTLAVMRYTYTPIALSFEASPHSFKPLMTLFDINHTFEGNY